MKPLAAIRLVLGGSMALMLGLSWPLWVGRPDFPMVPFVAGVPEVPPAVAWAAYLVMVGLILIGSALGALCLSGRSSGGTSRLGRWCDGAALVLLAALIVQDQNRLQPWAYLFVLMTLALATLPARQAGLACRILLVALYVHSGLSKLDVSFSRELGLRFLDAALEPFGLDPAGWPERARTAAVLAMPGFELLVGLGLWFERTRRIALIGAVAMHAGLIGILGPWALNHSTIVLTWNGFMATAAVLLFGWRLPEREAGEPLVYPAWSPVCWIIGVAVVLPFGERWGMWDVWPSWAVYASHTERVVIDVRQEALAVYPPSLRRHIFDLGEEGWRRVDLTGWSREVRGTPVYPQARAMLGLAEAMASWEGRPRPVRVRVWWEANRWTGRRESDTAAGLDAIRRLNSQFRLNAHPSKGAWARPGAAGSARGMQPSGV